MKTILTSVCGNCHSRGVGGGIRGAVMSAAGLVSFNSRKRDLWMLLFCLESEMGFFLGGGGCSGGWLTTSGSERIYRQTEAACLFTRLPLILCINPRLISWPMPNHAHSPTTYSGKTSVKFPFVTQFQCLSSPFRSVGVHPFVQLYYWCRRGHNRKSSPQSNKQFEL